MVACDISKANDSDDELSFAAGQSDGINARATASDNNTSLADESESYSDEEAESFSDEEAESYNDEEAESYSDEEAESYSDEETESYSDEESISPDQLLYSGNYYFVIEIIAGSTITLYSEINVTEEYLNATFFDLDCDGRAVELVSSTETSIRSDGTFNLPLGEFVVGACPDRFEFGEIELAIELEAYIASPTTLCGQVLGQIRSPLRLELAGSSFTAYNTEFEDPEIVLTMCNLN